LSRGNLDFLASLSVIPALEVLIQVGDNLLFREPVISTLVQDAVDNILLVAIRLETEGGEVSERLDVFVLHACIIPDGRGFVQRKLQKSCELVQEQDAQTKTDELEHFEDELRFLHACIIPHLWRIASLSRRK
jgi:hypothetical protein